MQRYNVEHFLFIRRIVNQLLRKQFIVDKNRDRFRKIEQLLLALLISSLLVISTLSLLPLVTVNCRLTRLLLKSNIIITSIISKNHRFEEA